MSKGLSKMNCLLLIVFAIDTSVSMAISRLDVSMNTSNSSKHLKGDSIASQSAMMKLCVPRHGDHDARQGGEREREREREKKKKRMEQLMGELEQVRLDLADH